MLRNRIYLGEISNNGQWFPGQHEAIVTPACGMRRMPFIERRKGRARHARHPALLADCCSRLMANACCILCQKKTAYRYYVPYLHKRRNAGATLSPRRRPDIGHLPAAEIENAVLAQIHRRCLRRRC